MEDHIGRRRWCQGIEEIIEELEDYKAGLETEILALEKRIKELKAKGKEEKKE